MPYPHNYFQAGDRTTHRTMQVITTVTTQGCHRVTVNSYSYAETWFEFLNEVEQIRYECQPLKGRSLVKYGDFNINFPNMEVPAITVKVGESMGGAGRINCRITYMVNGKKASKLEVMRLWA